MNFTVNEPILRDLASTGKGQITYSVAGLEQYRGQASFNLEVKRKETYGEQPYWEFKVDDLSYGITRSDPNGFKNYAEALKSAADKMLQLIGMEDRLESIYQEAEAQRQQEMEMERQRIKAQREADAPVGKKLAKRIIKEMQRIAREELSRWSDSPDVKVYERGTHKETKLHVTRSYAGLVLFSINYSRISRKDAEAMIADSNLAMLDVSAVGIPDPRVMNFLLTKSKK